MTAFVVSLTGCKKDQGMSIINTIWEQEASGVLQTLTFMDTICTLDLSSDSGEDVYHYSYEFEYPIVVLYPEDDNLAKMRGIVNSDWTTLTVVNTTTSKTIGIFFRK